MTGRQINKVPEAKKVTLEEYRALSAEVETVVLEAIVSASLNGVTAKVHFKPSPSGKRSRIVEVAIFQNGDKLDSRKQTGSYSKPDRTLFDAMWIAKREVLLQNGVYL